MVNPVFQVVVCMAISNNKGANNNYTKSISTNVSSDTFHIRVSQKIDGYFKAATTNNEQIEPDVEENDVKPKPEAKAELAKLEASLENLFKNFTALNKANSRDYNAPICQDKN